MTLSSPNPVKSALRTLDVIEFVVAFGQGAAAKDIAAGLGIPVSSLSYLLATLCERGYLQRDGRRYLPGPSLERLRTPNASLPLEERVAPIVRAITAEIDETTSFMVLDGWEARIVATAASAQALRYAIDPGERKPLHVLAGGKAILAALPGDRLDSYLAETEGRRVQATPRTITGADALREDIAMVQQRGFSLALEESTPGICSIGRGVRLSDGRIGAFGIAVPTIRYGDALQARAHSALVRACEALEG
ncbi:IclR family transcriptional regulator [Croceicoccus marinus]|uniref:IclR family transcriptional regulator n=1 Tax=Croceicoccus marinus TaxID=450378 RepID=A0A1Z1FGW2_9SPHN|nr:IclR family transcriptional regulator [Croceicoccus marinus]ARU18038.1 IclR family transcriptional regulator [Croceicoccus marinus]QNE07543.1 IclR family transcriptional regulator [Croceicoccus marinus]